MIRVAGHPVVLTHAHRRGIDPDVERPDPSTLERLGGPERARELVTSLYGRFEKDPELSRVFPHFLTGGIESFFMEWLGGERGYSTSTWRGQGLDSMHRGVHITRSLAGRWLRHLKDVLREMSSNAEAVEEILSSATRIALSMVNAEVTPLEASAFVKSCDGIQTRAFWEHEKLLTAAGRGRLGAVSEALQVDPSALERRGSDGRSLVWEAAARGRHRVLEELLSQGAGVNLPGCDPSSINLACSGTARLGTGVMVTPWAVARHRRHERVTELLEAHGALVDVFSAAYVGHRVVLDALYSKKPEIVAAVDPAEDFMRITPLHHAIAGGQREAAADLIDRGAPVSLHAGRLLTLAALQNRRDLVELLLDHGADPSQAGVLGPLDSDERPVADLLVARGYDVNANPLYGAMLVRACRGDVSQGGISRVAALIGYGADVNRADSGSLTPLHYAARSGNLPLIETLLDHGANVHAGDRDGLTPLAHLRKSRSKADPIPVLELLTSHGADVDNRSDGGETILFAFGRRADARVVEWLLEHGADATATNRHGRTAAGCVRGSSPEADRTRRLLRNAETRRAH